MSVPYFGASQFFVLVPHREITLNAGLPPTLPPPFTMTLMRKKSLLFAATALAAGLCTSEVHAVIIATQFDSTTGFSGPGEISPSTNDLLTGLIQAGSSFADQEGLNTDTTSVSLTNGVFGPAGLIAAPGPNPQVAIIGNNQTLTFTLGNGPFGAGYTVSEFRSYSGWQDSGRSRQDYTLFFSTVAAPTTFIPLITVAGAANTLDSLTVVKDSLGATIPNVYAIQIQTGMNVQNGYVGWREFDLIGTAAVPEPTSAGLLALGATTLLRSRRRR